MNDRNNGSSAALRRVRSTVTVAAVAVTVAACGPDIEGVYTPVGDSLLTSITLGSDGKAKVDTPLNLFSSGDTTYTVDDNIVSIVMPDGRPQPFTFADDCIAPDGAAAIVLGKLCKSGKAPAGAAAASAAPAASAAAAGGTESYLATTPEGRLQLDLLAGGTARMKMSPAIPDPSFPQGLTMELPYQRNGNDIVITMPGEGPMQLVRNGRDLMMTMDGETQRFVRQ